MAATDRKTAHIQATAALQDAYVRATHWADAVRKDAEARTGSTDAKVVITDPEYASVLEVIGTIEKAKAALGKAQP